MGKYIKLHSLDNNIYFYKSIINISMNQSFKRYWEPSTAEVLGSSLIVNSVATAITYPLEFVKTRIQIRSEGYGIRNYNHWGGYNPNKVFRQIHEQGRGLSGFYQGFDSHFVGRLGYLFLRNGIYKVLYDINKPFKPTNDLTTREKALIASIAGGIAAFVTTPFDLINIRTIADGQIPKEHRWNYSSLADGWSKITAQGGNKALWKGGMANVIRAVVLNISLTGPFDYLNEKMWITFGDNDFNKPFALFWAAFWGTAATLPFDAIRTRIMKQQANPEFNRLNYKGYLDVIGKSIEYERFFSLWSGF